MIVDILDRGRANALLADTIDRTISLVRSAATIALHGPNGPGQSSVSVSSMHEFRKKSGYYRGVTGFGLEESIRSLGEREVLVWLVVVETDQAQIAVWIDRDRVPVGVITFLKVST